MGTETSPPLVPSEPAKAHLPGHIPALDGIRGLAILGVLIVHSRPDAAASLSGQIWIKIAEAGAYGVDLFFVLSGFLITGILLDSRDSPTYFKSFYMRRVLRLVPVYYCYLLIAATVFPALHTWVHAKIPDYGGPWWWYLAYLSNWKPGQGAEDAMVGHFWSLAVEEQFYLFWPVVVYLLNRRRLVAFCFAIAAASFLLRCAFAVSGAHWNITYRMTAMRLDTLALGGLMAIYYRSPPAVMILRRWARPVCAACLTAFTILGCFAGGVEWRNPSIQTVGGLLLAVGFANLVFSAAVSEDGLLHRFTGNPVLRSLGKYSYAMYVYHVAIYTHCIWLVAYLSKRSSGNLGAALSVAYPFLVILASYLAARISWSLMERRILLLKDRFPYFS